MLLRMLLLLALWPVAYSASADERTEILSRTRLEVGSQTFTASNYHPGTVRHIVLFRYKDSVTREQQQEVTRRFLNLRESKRPGEDRPYVLSISTGEQASGENASMGFEQAFIVTFRSEGDRNYYVGTPIVEEPTYYDPEHAEFKAFVGPLLADQGVLVFDFISKGDGQPKMFP